jgi:nucleoside-diphosphate-sugar epimerase
MQSRKALVVGASGLVGGNFLKHLIATGTWDIVSLSRRPPADLGHVPHLSVDLLDPQQCRTAAPALDGVTHVFYCARAVATNYVISIDPNRQIVENLMDALLPVAQRLECVQIIHGMKWYGSNLGPYATPVKESQPRLPGRNFYYEQLDAIIDRQRGQKWFWSTLRPHFVCGLAVGSPSNVLSTLGAYAAILKQVGQPLDFPGPQGAFDANLNFTDVRLLARAMEWAATEPRCANEAFNIVNGDTFRWRDVWPTLANHFGMAAGTVRPRRLREFMADKNDVWATLAKKHGLRLADVADIADWAFADVLFEGAWDQTASMAKAYQNGFTDTVDTGLMLLDILQRYRELKLLP